MSTNKKIAIIGTVGLPAAYGGFETLADHLVRNLGDQYDLTVYCSSKKYRGAGRNRRYRGARLTYIPFDANGVQSVIYDTVSIIHSLFYADVLLILGVAGAWILPFVRLFTDKKIIISIDGIEWKREKWNLFARTYLWWAEKIAVKYSHIDISDNESIQDYTALRYGSLSRIIEYGADHVMRVTPRPEEKVNYPFLRKPYAFTVCRIEPENNVHLVLEAFSQLPKHVLVMVGNWNKSEYGMALRNKYGRYENIHMIDPIYDQRKLDLFRSNALVYIHGHSAGGTNPSLVEAMYLGLPIIAYGVSYNKTTTENKALYFMNEDELRLLIQVSSVGNLMTMGSTMKQIAYRRYTWERVTEKYAYLVHEVLQTKKKQSIRPAIERLDEEELLAQGAAHLKYAHLFYEKR